MASTAWHWQQRLGACDAPDEAYRRRLLQTRERIPYREWLKQKRAVARDRLRRAGADAESNGDAEKREKSEAAFREWRARKSREQRKQKAVRKPQKPLQPEGHVKPPSQHVNPKFKRASIAKTLNNNNTSSSTKGPKRSEAEVAAAYDAWMARVRLEDRVRRSQRRQETELQAQRAQEAHTATWKKKLVVCAYSTAAS